MDCTCAHLITLSRMFYLRSYAHTMCSPRFLCGLMFIVFIQHLLTVVFWLFQPILLKPFRVMSTLVSTCCFQSLTVEKNWTQYPSDIVAATASICAHNIDYFQSNTFVLSGLYGNSCGFIYLFIYIVIIVLFGMFLCSFVQKMLWIFIVWNKVDIVKLWWCFICNCVNFHRLVIIRAVTNFFFSINLIIFFSPCFNLPFC